MKTFSTAANPYIDLVNDTRTRTHITYILIYSSISLFSSINLVNVRHIQLSFYYSLTHATDYTTILHYNVVRRVSSVAVVE